MPLKALGRTLWKVAEALLSNTKGKSDSRGSAPVVKDSQETEKLVQKIMKDRLANIEERYGNHMAKDHGAQERCHIFAG